MDQTQLQEKIALFYSKLPPRAQEVFSDMKWLETIKTISDKYNLNDTQRESLGTETTMLMLGIIHIVEYEENLTKELGLTQLSTDKILVDVNDLILKGILPDLTNAFNENKKAEAEGTPRVDIDQALDERFVTLPPEIKKLVEDSDYKTTLYGIGKEYNLNVMQMGTLEQAVTDLFIGAIDPDDFENLLKNTIKLPEEEMEGLIGDVNEKIFREIRGKMVASSTEKPVIAKIPEFITHTDAHEEKKNTEILNKAGIEILSTQSSILPKPPKPVELTQQKPAIIKKSPEIKRETLLVIEKLEIEAGHTPMPALAPTPMPTPTPIDTPKEIPTEKLKEEIHPMLAQKLSSSVSSAVVKTEYSLNNLSKMETQNVTTQKTNIPKIDPYREIPE